MRDEMRDLLAEEPRKGYLRAKVFSVALVSLMTGLFLWTLVDYLLGSLGVSVIIAAGIAVALVWGVFLIIPPFLRRQRARLYENGFTPPYKPLVYFLTGREFLVPLEAVRNAEFYHDDEGSPNLRVDTIDGKTFLFTVGDSGREFFDALKDYFVKRAEYDQS